MSDPNLQRQQKVLKRLRALRLKMPRYIDPLAYFMPKYQDRSMKERVFNLMSGRRKSFDLEVIEDLEKYCEIMEKNKETN